jgi:replicative DNA helicase
MVTGIPHGYTKLDEMTSGLQPSDLIIVAARPSMGKTAFSLNIATHACDQVAEERGRVQSGNVYASAHATHALFGSLD